MKIKKQSLFFSLFGLFATTVCGYPNIQGIQTDKLLSASVIVIGQIDWMTNAGNSVILDTVRGHGNIPAVLLKIGVTVNQQIKGVTGTKIQVGGFLTPADNINFGYLSLGQIPNPASIYRNVFFLSPGKDVSEYVPAFPKEFAIEIQCIPNEEANSPMEMLRSIAKANVEDTNYALAVRWAEFLSGLHDDFSYWTNKTQDARILIRSTAYATLVQDFPQTPGLRANLVKCLSNPIPSIEDSDVWMANYSFIASLSKLFEKDPPKAFEIKSLLGSGDRNVDEMALTLVRGGNDKQMAADVVHLMTTSKNRDVQYYCIQTLSILSGDQNYISQPTFLQQPDLYIQEWQKK